MLSLAPCHNHRQMARSRRLEMRGDATDLHLITGICPSINMRQLSKRMASLPKDRGLRETDTSASPKSERVAKPTLVLFSSDKGLTALVRKTVKTPWKIEL